MRRPTSPVFAIFGECSLFRQWGRIGRAGTVRIETYQSQGAADTASLELD
ncbi:WGR domain-containing protein [Bradyrhizobium septentrionale]